MESLVDPKIFGPGGWDRIHIDATRCTSKSWYGRYDEDVRFYASKIHCKDCKEHFLKLLDSDPPLKRKTVYKDGVDVTMFYWSVDAHNAVNRRLKKKEVAYETAYDFYYNGKGCDSNCGSSIPQNVKSLIDGYLYEGKYASYFK